MSLIPKNKVLAWVVHLFTASGAVWGVLAVLAIQKQVWMAVFAWMSIAIFVDAFDGILARRFRVKEVLPNFDGALLDNILDYFNYVIVPVFFMYEVELVPVTMVIIASSAVLLSSAYQFCQTDAKTDDHYFKGFPSYWNVTVLYMFILGLNQWINFALIVLFCILVFVPIKYIYPSQAMKNKRLNLWLSIAWGMVCIAILAQFPHHPLWLVWLSLAYVIYYFGYSFYITIRQSSKCS
ncbi:MAG: hypothetical protein B6242_12200 [Anaerolineaceae bacterium 4572_78]|nr:MAG: hypothetical protein B6242_12200 [Anaerolineaceae bacterium 4572_78]